MTSNDSLETANQFIMDNLLIILLSLSFIIIGYWLYRSEDRITRKKKTKRKVKKVSDSDGLWFITMLVGFGALGYFITGLILILTAGSYVVIGNWFVYGVEPSGTLQWFLVIYMGLLIFITFIGELIG